MASKNFSANLKIGATMSSSVGRVFGGVNKKIKEQEATLKKLRSAYKDAAKGTGEYAGQLDKLQKEIDQTEAKLKRMKAAGNFKMGTIGSALGGDLKRLALGAGIAVGAIGAVGGAVFSVTKGFVDWADDIGDSAEALQMSTQALQTWQFAAATVGVGGAKMTASIAKFSKTLNEGSDKTIETLAKLHINGKRLKKLKLDQQLEVIAEAFKDYKGAGKAAIAMDLFGKSGYQLAGILSKGKQGLDEFRKAGEETGAVLDDDAAASAGKAASALDMLGITMVGLRNTIAIQFVPALTRMVEKFTQFVRTNGPQIREWATKFAVLIENKVVPAIGKLMDKMPAILDGFGTFATKLFNAADGLQGFLGGWDNLGILLLALNFAPTIAAVGNLAAALWTLSGASWAVVGPWGLIAAAIGGFVLVVSSIVDPGGPLDILGKMFPETMEKIRSAVESAVNWIGAKFDWLSEKITGFMTKLGEVTGMGSFFADSPGVGRDYKPRQYDLPRRDYGSILGVQPKGQPNPLQLPVPDAPPATKGDLMEFLKPQSSNNTYNINVNAPGANGDDIAERIRRTFERKPLFDSDGALVPG